MENLVVNAQLWRGKRVFLTGHTGFKGGWLAMMLADAGAQVHGYAQRPPTEPNLFEVANVSRCLSGHVIADVRDADALKQAMVSAAPDVVFHLAAQPLVRYSYGEPVETYSVNVLGTVHLLEAARACPSVRAIVNVTTDKCYENKEWLWGYRETDPLGGHDPYSNSKACAELVTAAYRDSFLKDAGVAVATARAGNVIGGGDWAADRLIPDYFRAVGARLALDVRFPDATRPWQHVLEPLAGYVRLAERLLEADTSSTGAWNFGPADEEARPVRWMLDNLSSLLPGPGWRDLGGAVHEAGYLKLDSSKARAELGWRPQWSLARALEMTVAWHTAWRQRGDMHQVCLDHIRLHGSTNSATV